MNTGTNQWKVSLARQSRADMLQREAEQRYLICQERRAWWKHPGNLALIVVTAAGFAGVGAVLYQCVRFIWEAL